MIRRFAAATVLLTASLTAQGIASPTSFGPAEAPFWATYGLGHATAPSAMLAIHEDMQGQSATLRGVSFRRDAQTTTGYSAHTMVVNVWVSTAATRADAPDATFINNHGPDRQQVVAFGLVQVPALPASTLPAPFAVTIPFQTPFAWTGQGPLCLEIQVVSRSTGQNILFDLVTTSFQANPAVATRNFGLGCRATGNYGVMRLTATANSNWPGNAVTLNYTGSSLPRSALVSLLIGGSSSQFGAVPLPFVLPGTTAAPSGTCTLYTDALLAIPVLSNSSGGLDFSLGLGVSPALNGLSLYAQALAVDPTANAFGVALSNGAQHQVVAPWSNSVGTVYANGSFGPVGTVRANEGFVCRFET